MAAATTVDADDGDDKRQHDDKDNQCFRYFFRQYTKMYIFRLQLAQVGQSNIHARARTNTRAELRFFSRFNICSRLRLYKFLFFDFSFRKCCTSNTVFDAVEIEFNVSKFANLIFSYSLSGDNSFLSLCFLSTIKWLLQCTEKFPVFTPPLNLFLSVCYIFILYFFGFVSCFTLVVWIFLQLFPRILSLKTIFFFSIHIRYTLRIICMDFYLSFIPVRLS